MRRVVLILLLLLAGAIVNVGMAWGCAAFFMERPSSVLVRSVNYAGPDYTNWKISSGRELATLRIRSSWTDPDVPEFGTNRRGPPPFQDLLDRWPAFLRPSGRSTGAFHNRWIEARGWPLLSLWSGQLLDGRGQLTRTHIRGIRIPDRPSFRPGGKHVRVLPLAPMWPGFAVNTIFYATVLWLLHYGPFVLLRRVIRQRRGLCPRCAYPMGESAVCTECGKALPGRAEAAT